MSTSPMNIETPDIGTTHIVTKNWLMIIINCAFVAIGQVAGPLLMRLYYLHGGNRKWLASFTQSGGFPVLVFPIIFLFIQSKLSTRKNDESPLTFWLEPKLFLSSAVIGILSGVGYFMYSLGLSYIPVSTSSLLYATQLCFIAFFSRLIVKQRFTAYIINAIVVMTLGSALLGINTDVDRPVGVSKAQYLLGFLLTLGTAVLAGLLMPLVQLTFSKAIRNINYASLLQFQFISSLFATTVCVIGMLVNKDFQAIPREANEFELGKAKYYIIIVVRAVICQFSVLGTIGVIVYASALFNGILASALVPVTGVAAVIFYHESFTGLKGTALVLCLWGFCSYFYGEYKMMKKMMKNKVTNIGSPEETADDVENEPRRLDNHEEP
ncbi:hypothetical protein MKW94_026885 [Papaver nudicaule]|uniref:Probable purine permease n=1 Tax=Papaver nudicaule TaxID=74823 RepID=A0AA41SDR1_PAPNU|nr:hypothetical protein [Papaver nudicaule]